MKNPAMLSKQTKGKRGAVAVYVAILLIVFIGFVALAVDIGYVMVVRNQLQNAADAAALAGCNQFYSRDPVTLPFPEPNWQAAEAEAADAVNINEAAKQRLEEADIATGYWNITQSILGLRDKLTYTPTTNDGPAIQVAIAKSGTKNSGAILTFFAGILGIETVDLAAQATAVAASPGSVRPESLLPVAISKKVADVYEQYDDPDNLFTIGSPYMYPDTLAGQWTSFFLDANDVTSVRGLLENGNPTAVSIGDLIWIEPGVKDTLYDNKNQPSVQNLYAGQNVFLPIIDAVILKTTHSEVPVSGFIGFHITCAGTGCGEGNLKIIRGYFTTAPSYGGPIGPHYGPLDRCRLCQ